MAQAKQSFGGKWTAEKLARLRKYLHMATFLSPGGGGWMLFSACQSRFGSLSFTRLNSSKTCLELRGFTSMWPSPPPTRNATPHAENILSAESALAAFAVRDWPLQPSFSPEVSDGDPGFEVIAEPGSPCKLRCRCA